MFLVVFMITYCNYFGIGDLVRSLLIQIQKAKVDGELAMSALDKLLRSNELNFAFLAVVPTLLVLYGMGQWISSSLKNRRGRRVGRLHRQVRHSLR
jgi:nuclear control of ATPase protein 2